MPVYLDSVANKKITANATLLTTAINAAATTLVFDHDVFAAGNVIRIGGEEITLGTTSDNKTFNGCTRSGSPETHAAGQEAWLAAGAALVSHEFSAGEYFNFMRCSANADFTLGIVEDDVLKERIPYPLYGPPPFLPFHREQPGAGKKWALVLWLRADIKAECEASGALVS